MRWIFHIKTHIFSSLDPFHSNIQSTLKAIKKSIKNINSISQRIIIFYDGKSWHMSAKKISMVFKSI